VEGFAQLRAISGELGDASIERFELLGRQSANIATWAVSGLGLANQRRDLVQREPYRLRLADEAQPIKDTLVVQAITGGGASGGLKQAAFLVKPKRLHSNAGATSDFADA